MSVTGFTAVVALVLLLGCAPGAGQEDVVVGLVTNNVNGLRNIEGFRDGLAEHGYVEGEDLQVRFADEPLSGDALEAELQRFAAEGVDLVFTAGTPTGVAAHRILGPADIPVVFGVILDPVAAGVLTDLDRPGGTITGVKLSTDQVRRLELFLRIAADAERILIPYNPDDNAAATAVAQIQAAADEREIELVLAPATDDDEVRQVIADIDEAIDAIFLVNDSVVNAHLGDIVAAAERSGLPVSGPSTAQVEGGALMAYGFIHERAGAQAARIAAQVLEGADPGELPVEDAESFLAINLAAADAIGVEIPDSLLQQAAIIVRDEDGG